MFGAGGVDRLLLLWVPRGGGRAVSVPTFQHPGENGGLSFPGPLD